VKDRLPPFDAEGEEAVLAALMVDDTVYERLLGLSKPEHFFRETNRWVFQEACRLGEDGEPINQITVAHRLAVTGRLDDVGGQYELARMIRQLPTTVGIEYYANVLRDLYVKRALLEAAHQIEELAFAADGEPNVLLGSALERIMAIESVQSDQRDVRSIREVLDDGLFDEIGNIELGVDSTRYIPTGLSPLDFLIRGWRKGGVTFISAPPSLGKSLFIQDRVIDLARRGIPVLLFTTEMADFDVASRQIFMLAELDEIKVRRSEDKGDTGYLLQKAMEEARTLPIFYKDSGDLTVERLEQTVHREIARRKIQVVFVDHFHELTTERRFSGGEAEMAYIAAGLQRVGRKYDIPMVVAAQQNRGDHNGNMNESLKGSSALEQKAVATLFFRTVDPATGETLLTPDEARERAGNPGWSRVRMTAAKVRSGGMTGSQDVAVDWRVGGKYYPWRSWETDFIGGHFQ